MNGQTPPVIPSYPCSALGFAIRAFDHRNAPDYEAGDLLIIDPAMKPSHDDWVLASLGPAHSLIFARYLLPGLNLDVERRVEGMLAQIKETIANSVANLVEAEGSGEGAAVPGGACRRYYQTQNRRARWPPERVAGAIPRRALSVPRLRRLVACGRLPKAIPDLGLYDLKAIDAAIDRMSGIGAPTNALDLWRESRNAR